MFPQFLDFVYAIYIVHIGRLKFKDQMEVYAFYLCCFKLVYLIKMKTEIIGRVLKISIPSVVVGLNSLFFINFWEFYDQTNV